MKITITKPATLIGEPYLATMLDENGSLQSAWQDMAQQGQLQALDDLATKLGVVKSRTTLLAFSPYTFIAWIGGLFPNDTDVPKGLKAFDLPASQTASYQEKAYSFMPLPLTDIMNVAMAKFKKAQVPLPEHLAFTQRPYFLETYQLNGQGDVTQLINQIYLSKTEADQDEDYID